MAERQKHGFMFEQYCAERYNLTLNEDYTARFDALTEDGVPVSIKCEKFGSDVELADLFRNAENDTDFILIVGFWETEKTNIIDIKSCFINASKWKALFDQNLLLQYRELLASITNERSDDAKWSAAIKELRTKWGKSTGNIIRPRPKRDHKTQKRVQCAINNKDFYSKVCGGLFDELCNYEK